MAKRSNRGKKVLLIVAVAFVVLAAFGLFLGIALNSVGVSGFEKKLAIIPIKGTIIPETDSFSGTFGALEIVEKINEAENDPTVGALFFDIDSPGGEIVATHQIVEKIREIQKPTISYIGSVGASGGYYVAAATDYIISDPFSVTGSVGAIWMIPNLKEFLDEFGIKFRVVRSGNLKALPNPFEEINEEHEKIIVEMVGEIFEQFKADILLFREGKINPIEFETITDGRIISGKQALELNLVDELLTREKAILRAAEIADIKGKPVLVEYNPVEITFFDFFAKSGIAFANGIKSSINFADVASFRT